MAEREKVSLTLHYQVIADVDKQAQKLGHNRSSMVNFILREWLEAQKKK